MTGSAKAMASTGWETMLASLMQTQFTIVGTWPIRTEGGHRICAEGTNALASSIVLVCRPRPDDAPATSRRRFLDALRAELPAAITEMKTGRYRAGRFGASQHRPGHGDLFALQRRAGSRWLAADRACRAE